MNISRWSILAFALIGVLTIALLTFTSGPDETLESVDRHTGLSQDELIDIARQSGNAVAALEFLERHEVRFVGHRAGIEAIAALKAELAEYDARPPAEHARTDEITNELRRAAATLEELARAVSHDDLPPRDKLVPLLKTIEADAAIGTATEGFFSAATETGDGIDSRAVLLLASASNTGDTAPHMQVAADFRSEGRMRANLRWLLRSYSVAGATPVARNTLATTYLDINRLTEAQAVLDVARRDGADDLDFWKLRARLGMQLTNPEIEGEALRHVLAAGENLEDMRRMIEIQRFLGNHAEALALARMVADKTGARGDHELTVVLALEGGFVGTAIELLEAYAQEGDDLYWRERIVEYALLDMRIDRAIQELVALNRDYPDKGFEEDLEGLYRRTQRLPELAALLHERLRNNPRDTRAGDEVIGIYVAIGDREQASAVLAEHFEHVDHPRAFFTRLTSYKAAGIEETDSAALQWVRSDLLQPEDIPFVIEASQYWAKDPTYREVITVLADRFDNQPMARDTHMMLITSLFAAGENAEAVRRLEAHVSTPGTTLAERLSAAELLNSIDRQDQALEQYYAVYDEDPDNATALLRIGQILCWSGAPVEAVPFLERRLEVTPEQRALVRAQLAEAHFSSGRPGVATRHFEKAVRQLEKLPALSTEERIWLAKVHARLRHEERAARMYANMVTVREQNIDLILDYVEFLTAFDHLVEAREWMDRATAIRARHPRVLRVEGHLSLREHRYDNATLAMETAREVLGPDPGVEADLGYALHLSGDWRSSKEAYQRASVLAPQNREISRALRDSQDDLTPMLGGQVRSFTVDDDKTLEIELAGSTVMIDERTRLTAAVGHGDYEGESAVVPGGVEEDLFFYDVAASHQPSANSEIAAGARYFDSAPGSGDLGGWAAYDFVDSLTGSAFFTRAYYNDLWTNPAAAVGLEGRAHGLEIGGQRNLAGQWWLNLAAHVRELSLADPTAGNATIDDPQVMASASVGYRIRGDQQAVIDPFRVERSALFPRSPYLIGQQDDSDKAFINSWLTYEAIRLLGNEEVATLVPIGDDFNYVTIGMSAEDRIAANTGGRVDAYIGADVGEGDFLWGLGTSLTWRPGYSTEFFLQGAVGQALGRSFDNATAVEFVLGLYVR
jgi:tetratricopeptide (TPR) repeat protein